MRIAVIGATGVVGRAVIADLLARASDESPFAAPSLFATSRSAGESVPWMDDDELVVERYDPELIRGTEAAIIATPADAAATIIPRLRELGITSIDLSSAHRDRAPLCLDAALTGGASFATSPVISMPSADALQLARVCLPLRELGLTSARVVAMRAASGAGMAGIAELAESTGRLLNGMEPENPILGHRMAFNAIPQVGAFLAADTGGEVDLQQDARKLIDGLVVASTLLWAPWFYGNVQALSLGFSRPVSPEDVHARLKGAPFIKVLDDPSQAVYPMPSLATGDDSVLVGRIRPDPAGFGVLVVSAMDNAQASAAHAVAALEAVARARAAH